MQLWRIHLKPGKGDDTQRCIVRKILGIGGPLSPKPKSKEDYIKRGSIKYKHEKDGFKKNTDAIFDGMQIDDLVWTKTRDGVHYLGRITGGWSFADNIETSTTEVVIVRPCDWQEVGMDDIHP